MDADTAPDLEHIALVIIDMQNDFALEGAVCEVEGTSDVVPKIRALADFFRQRHWPIVHVIRFYVDDGSNADLCRRRRIKDGMRIVSPGSDGAEIVDELKPKKYRLDARSLLEGGIQCIEEYEYVIYKPRWGAFYDTALEEFLRGRRINTLLIAGCNFPNCPRTTIYEASERDFRLIVAKDAISKAYPIGLDELAGIGVSVLSVEDFLALASEKSPRI
jgi:nicotinamidase-related amidase